MAENDKAKANVQSDEQKKKKDAIKVKGIEDMFICLDVALIEKSQQTLCSILRSELENVNTASLPLECSVEWKRRIPSLSNVHVFDYECINCVALILPPKLLVPLLVNNKLRSYIEHITNNAIPQDSRLVVICEGLESYLRRTEGEAFRKALSDLSTQNQQQQQNFSQPQKVASRQKQNFGSGSLSHSEAEKAIIELQVALTLPNLACVFQTKNVAETADLLLSLTKFLSEMPYKKQSKNLSIRKSKALPSQLNSPSSLWQEMIQQIPKLTDHHASALVQHYPTMSSLYEVYEKHSVSEIEKENLLKDIKVSLPGKESRSFGHALSSKVFKVLTSTDGEAIV